MADDKKIGETYRRALRAAYAKRVWKCLTDEMGTAANAAAKLGVDQSVLSRGKNDGRLTLDMLISVLLHCGRQIQDLPALPPSPCLQIIGFHSTLPTAKNCLEQRATVETYSVSLVETCYLRHLTSQQDKWLPAYSRTRVAKNDGLANRRLEEFAAEVPRLARSLYQLVTQEVPWAITPEHHRFDLSVEQMHSLLVTWGEAWFAIADAVRVFFPPK